MGVEVAPLRLAIVEDENLYRELLVTCLEQDRALEVVGSYAHTDSALAGILSLTPDAVILDIDLPGSMNGVELGLRLRRSLPSLGIVLLSNHSMPQLLGSLPAETVGGWSYLLKKSVADLPALTRAIHGAVGGMVTVDASFVTGMRAREGARLEQLTQRQREVLELLAQGYTNSAIAGVLVLTEKAVEKHVSSLYEELGIDRQDASLQPRVQAVLTYLRETQLQRSSVPVR
ncbi:MAG: response regulator transcription factor [Chloroflexi bacterium]|nr:response regulator transcription factor [Chloroflexota bacterium]